ncbi:hypothetical protein [Rhizobium oryziradicis]|uniref:Uncharacterized protein n=1 Tax=Rhizobium oryziradicis TaxID=1867956 RepID=A0A1Q8ZPW4_9HYPH|nr:hypothetical protein [Rhizobium oryziradicis]OLP44129.1 hypothetical protein BJF95_06075 [Rhizobium oryziradicis]
MSESESQEQEDMFDPQANAKKMANTIMTVIEGHDSDDVINALSSILGLIVFHATPHERAAREVAINVSAQINFIAQDLHVRGVPKAGA